MSRRSNPFGIDIVSLPKWADYTALPPGKFIEFTLNKPADAGMVRPNLYNWVGGAFVPDFGARGGVCYHGGGEHSAWTDSSTTGPGQQGVYVLDCDTRRYTRRCYPNANHAGALIDGSGGPTDDWGAYTDDGSPQSKHTYNGCSYMPAAWGGGSQGSFMRVGHAGGVSLSLGRDGGVYGPGLTATWRFDLSKASHTIAEPSIFKLSGSSTYDYGSATPSRINDAPMACIDHTREGWWSSHRTGTTRYGERMVFTSKTGVVSGPQGAVLSTGWAALHHFADDDVIVRITDHLDAPNIVPIWQVFVWRAGSSSAWAQASVVRQDIADTFGNGNKAYTSIGYMHPTWSKTLGCFVCLDPIYPYGAQPTTTIRVWKVIPPPAGKRVSGNWQITWELVTAKAGTESTNFMSLTNSPAGDAGTLNGSFGRFVECPSLRAFVWTRDVDKPGQLIRLRGM